MSFAIVCDSTADLLQSQLESHNIIHVPLYVHFQGETHKDWLDISPTEILEGVKAGADLPKTSQPTPVDFQQAYKKAATEGVTEIICLTISSELSGTYQSACLAAEESPIPVTVIDSRSASWALGAMVIEVAKAREAGKSAQEGIALVEHILESFGLYFCVGTLEFLKKGGRIGRASAFLGSVLNIKPILGLDDGSIIPRGRARGAKRAVKEMAKFVTAYQEKHAGEAIYAYLFHVSNEEQVEKFKQVLDTAGGTYNLQGMYEMGSVLTSHVGPETFGIVLYTLPSA